MTANIIRPRKKRGEPQEHPYLLLYCDARSCTTREKLHQTTFAGLSKWVRENNWRTIHRGGHLFDHRCDACERRRRGLTPDYIERLHA